MSLDKVKFTNDRNPDSMPAEDTSTIGDFKKERLNALASRASVSSEDIRFFLEQEGEIGRRIASLAEEYPEALHSALFLTQTLNGPHVRELFSACADLLDAGESGNEYAEKTFGKRMSPAQEAESRQIIRAKAAELIVRAAEQMPNENMESLIMHHGGTDVFGKISADIRKVVQTESVQARLFASVFRLLMRSHENISLEEIRGASLEEVLGDTMKPEDVETILRIQGERYRNRYPDSELRELREDLGRALKSPDSHFYVYRKDGEVVTFVRFDDPSADNDMKRHMGSFMTNPKFEGGALGQALLDVALQRELERGDPLYAECDPSLVPFYEKFGFRKIRGPYKDTHGVETCDIVLEPSSESRVAA